MTDETDLKDRPARWALRGSVAVIAAAAVLLLLLLWSDFGPSTGEEVSEGELAAVTFIVGGMMKSRSGAT